MSGFAGKRGTVSKGMDGIEDIQAHHEGRRIITLKPVRKEYIWGREDWLFSSLHPELGEAPFLVKEITAGDSLSLQVHPGDDFAQKKEGSRGKTEMWYILDCQPDAFLYYGLKHKASPEEISKRIENGTILEICRKIPVSPGDVFYLPAGEIHAIGAGIRLLEVQQNSNITYRIYDYERKNQDNQPRQLHIEQALEVSDYAPNLFGKEPMGSRIEAEAFAKTLLVECDYFKVMLYEVWGILCLKKKISRFFFVLEGTGWIRREEGELEIRQGDCLYLEKDVFPCEIRGKVKLAAVSEGRIGEP